MFTQDIISKLIIVFLIRLKMYKKWNRVCSDKLEQKLSKALVQNWEQTLEPLISNDHPFHRRGCPDPAQGIFCQLILPAHPFEPFSHVPPSTVRHSIPGWICHLSPCLTTLPCWQILCRLIYKTVTSHTSVEQPSVKPLCCITSIALSSLYAVLCSQSLVPLPNSASILGQNSEIFSLPLLCSIVSFAPSSPQQNLFSHTSIKKIQRPSF